MISEALGAGGSGYLVGGLTSTRLLQSDKGNTQTARKEPKTRQYDLPRHVRLSTVQQKQGSSPRSKPLLSPSLIS